MSYYGNVMKLAQMKRSRHELSLGVNIPDPVTYCGFHDKKQGHAFRAFYDLCDCCFLS